jgi:hypothetical protein
VSELVLRWVGVITLLVLVYIVFRNADQFKSFVNSLTAGFSGTVIALQGGNPGKYVS